MAQNGLRGWTAFSGIPGRRRILDGRASDGCVGPSGGCGPRRPAVQRDRRSICHIAAAAAGHGPGYQRWGGLGAFGRRHRPHEYPIQVLLGSMGAVQSGRGLHALVSGVPGPLPGWSELAEKDLDGRTCCSRRFQLDLHSNGDPGPRGRPVQRRAFYPGWYGLYGTGRAPGVGTTGQSEVGPGGDPMAAEQCGRFAGGAGGPQRSISLGRPHRHLHRATHGVGLALASDTTANGLRLYGPRPGGPGQGDLRNQ